MHITTVYLENQAEKVYYGTNMVLLCEDHALLNIFCTDFVLISFNIFIYMLTYQPTIFACETTNQVEVALVIFWYSKHITV